MKQDQRRAISTTQGLLNPPTAPSRLQPLPRFTFLHPTKHIFKKRGRAGRKCNKGSPKVTDQQPTSSSSHHLQAQLLPLLQSQQSVEPYSSEKDLEPTLDHSHVHYPSQLTGEAGQGEAGDVSGYMLSIGQHLFRQQGRCLLPVLLYSERFDHQARIGNLHLIFGFCLRYGFKVETIFLAFSIYHRVAFSAEFQRHSFALQALSSLFVAAKYEEIAIPKAEIFARYVQEDGVSADSVLEVEAEILLHLNFNLSLPTVLHFIDLLRLRYGLDSSVREKLITICYKSLNSLSLWQERPSLLAMAALHLFSPSLDMGQWQNKQLEAELEWRTAELLRVGVPQQEC